MDSMTEVNAIMAKIYYQEYQSRIRQLDREREEKEEEMNIWHWRPREDDWMEEKLYKLKLRSILS